MEKCDFNWFNNCSTNMGRPNSIKCPFWQNKGACFIVDGVVC